MSKALLRASSKEPSLFDFLHGQLRDENMLYRKVFLDAFHKEVPDFAQLCQEQENSNDPDAGYVALCLASIDNRMNQRTASMARLMAASLPQIVPQWSGGWQGEGEEVCPLSLLVDDKTFNGLMSSPNKGRHASQMLAEVMAFIGYGATPLGSVQHRSRVERLIKEASIEEVAKRYLSRHKEPVYDDKKRSKVQREFASSWPQDDYKEMFSKLEKIWGSIRTHESKPKPMAPQPQTKAASSPNRVGSLQRSGAVADLLNAREQLSKALRGVRGKEADNRLLSNPNLHQAVRNTCLQQDFFLLCAQMGAFENKEPSKGILSAAGNPLLAGLDALEAGSKTASEKAFDSFASYMQSIVDPQDLSQVIASLNRILGRSGGNKMPTQVLELVSTAAARIGYTPSHALEAVALDGYNFTKAIKPLLAAANGGRWQAADLEAMLLMCPRIIDENWCNLIINTVCAPRPGVFADLSDEAMTRLTTALFTQGNYCALGSKKDEPSRQAFRDRIKTLDEDHRVVLFQVLSVQGGKVFYDDGNDKELRSQVMKELLASSKEPDAILGRAIENFGHSFRFLCTLVDDLDSVGVDNQAKILERAKQNYWSKAQFIRLLGYGSGYDKATTLSSLSHQEAFDCFTKFALEALDYEVMGGRAKHSGAPLDAIFKNIVFDMNEILAPSLKDRVVPAHNLRSLEMFRIARKGESITWEAICHIVAPFLDLPRPSLEIQTPGDLNAGASASGKSVLDKHDVAQRLAIFPNISGNMMKHGFPLGNFGGLPPGVICHPRMPMPSPGKILAHMLLTELRYDKIFPVEDDLAPKAGTGSRRP